MNGRRIVAVQQHVAAPVAHADNEQLDLKIAGRLLRENLKDPLLRILVLYRRLLRTFRPGEHVFHWNPPLCGEMPRSDLFNNSLPRPGVVGKAVIGPKRHSRRCKRVVAIGSTADKLRRRA
jgi:hypothetical protein